MINKHEDSFWGGIIKALGLVFGDIGTSPIYTLTVVFAMTEPTVAQPLMMNSRRVDRVLMIVGPPGLPTANQSDPSFRNTKVGVIAESGRFRGPTALFSPWIKPYA